MSLFILKNHLCGNHTAPQPRSGCTALAVGGTHGWHASLHPPSRVSGGTALAVGGTHGWHACLPTPSKPR
ncbi:MAG: hypothetical protein IJU35_05170 [Paludibacteraceae bacterium]|nr:hypothetical protein [Paludibacteraceae bacterium]